MPNPGLTDEQCREAVDGYRDYGSIGAAARALGIDRGTFRNRLKRAGERGLTLSGGAFRAVQNAGLSAREARAGWIVNVDPETGSRESTYWRADDLPPEAVIDAIRDGFENMKPAKPVTPPEHIMGDLCTVYPLMDAHFGMLAWGQETGGPDYDMALAAQDMRHAFAKVAALTPPSAEAVLIIGGDFFHQDDNRSETPQNRHKLDTDGRYFKVLDSGIALISEVVETIAAKHAGITVRILRGNHDEHAHMVLTFALSERYRDDARITVEKTPRDLFMKQWGRCLISAHHGDKAPPERLTLYLSDVCPYWSETRYRHCFTGHVHKDQAKDTGPLKWESLRAFCPSDSYAASMGYTSRRAMQSITFHKQDGLVLRAFDPIER